MFGTGNDFVSLGMQDNSLRSTLECLGLKQAELARLVDVTPRSVSLWATGALEIPGPVAAYLRILRAAPPDVLASELKRLARRGKALGEGLYSLTYKGETDGFWDQGSALALLRNGRITGSDGGGAVFTGSYEFDVVRQTNKVRLHLSVPPEGMLVTGYAAGPGGAALDIVGEFERAASVSSIKVEAAGRPIVVRLTYLGPLPS